MPGWWSVRPDRRAGRRRGCRPCRRRPPHSGRPAQRRRAGSRGCRCPGCRRPAPDAQGPNRGLPGPNLRRHRCRRRPSPRHRSRCRRPRRCRRLRRCRHPRRCRHLAGAVTFAGAVALVGRLLGGQQELDVPRGGRLGLGDGRDERMRLGEQGQAVRCGAGRREGPVARGEPAVEHQPAVGVGGGDGGQRRARVRGIDRAPREVRTVERVLRVRDARAGVVDDGGDDLLPEERGVLSRDRLVELAADDADLQIPAGPRCRPEAGDVRRLRDDVGAVGQEDVAAAVAERRDPEGAADGAGTGRVGRAGDGCRRGRRLHPLAEREGHDADRGEGELGAGELQVVRHGSRGGDREVELLAGAEVRHERWGDDVTVAALVRRVAARRRSVVSPVPPLGCPASLDARGVVAGGVATRVLVPLTRVPLTGVALTGVALARVALVGLLLVAVAGRHDVQRCARGARLGRPAVAGRARRRPRPARRLRRPASSRRRPGARGRARTTARPCDGSARTNGQQDEGAPTSEISRRSPTDRRREPGGEWRQRRPRPSAETATRRPDLGLRPGGPSRHTSGT